MEAGKRRLAGDTARAATTDEVKDLRRESRDLKECVADLTLVADRLHLLQDHRLGLDVSVDRARRLLALHHRLAAVQHNAD